jgi:hypothetical protein
MRTCGDPQRLWPHRALYAAAPRPENCSLATHQYTDPAPCRIKTTTLFAVQGSSSPTTPAPPSLVSRFVECAARKRAAPRSQFVGVAASGVERFGHVRRGFDARASLWCRRQGLQYPTQSSVGLRCARPNPSFNRRANGTPPSPGRWYSVHFHRPGLGGAPLPPG